MTKSFYKGQLRRYRETHPWAKKLPVRKKEVVIGLIPGNYEEPKDRWEDYAWAIVRDKSREGEWLWELADNGWVNHVCSICRFAINTDFHVSVNYTRCPVCRANMVKQHGVKFTDKNIIIY